MTVRLAARSRVLARSIRRRREVGPWRLAVGRGERPGEVEAGVAGLARHRVEVERLGVVAIDEVAGPPESGQEEERVLSHSPSIGESPA